MSRWHAPHTPSPCATARAGTRGERLRVPDNITLLLLAPYPPETQPDGEDLSRPARQKAQSARLGQPRLSGRAMRGLVPMIVGSLTGFHRLPQAGNKLGRLATTTDAQARPRRGAVADSTCILATVSFPGSGLGFERNLIAPGGL